MDVMEYMKMNRDITQNSLQLAELKQRMKDALCYVRWDPAGGVDPPSCRLPLRMKRDHQSIIWNALICLAVSLVLLFIAWRCMLLLASLFDECFS